MMTDNCTKTLEDYMTLVRSKARRASPTGLDKVPALNSALFPYQSDSIDFLLRSGCGAGFLDTGMGKAFIGLEWARVLVETLNRPALMFAPLAVGRQHAKEAERFGIDARHIRNPSEIDGARIYITNYERMHLFDASKFVALVCDESSIVKSFGGKTSLTLIAFAEKIRYVLALTATPAPNDHMELGQHSALLRIMPSNEMLMRWFIADQSDMGKYRLKKHGVDDFWSWMASWSRMAARPSDLGYSDAGFERPGHDMNLHYIGGDMSAGAQDGELFRKVDTSATQIHKEKRITAGERAQKVAELVAAEPNEPWCIWCDTDYEADELIARIPSAVEVRGSMKDEIKEDRLAGFYQGDILHLITKPEIGGFGLNFQHCARTAFVGLSFSYERFYQAIRRFDRYGQKRKVQAHIAMGEAETIIWQTIQRKARDHETMKSSMTAAMHRAVQRRECKTAYIPRQTAKIPAWVKA